MEKTMIKMELNLIFDDYVEMSLITNKIGFSPSSSICKRATRKSPFEDDHLPGYWSIVTENIETYDLEDVTKILLEKINPYLDKIKSVLIESNGIARFCVVAELLDNLPALSFSRDFLQVVEYLEAEIDIDMYADLAGVEYNTTT